MPIKENRIEFRCTAAMKSRLLELRPLLGVRTLSEAARAMLERLLVAPTAAIPWTVTIPALREIALHLDRIASALQRCLLDGSAPGEYLQDLQHLLPRIGDLLDGATGQRSTDPRPGGRGRR